VGADVAVAVGAGVGGGRVGVAGTAVAVGAALAVAVGADVAVGAGGRVAVGEGGAVEDGGGVGVDEAPHAVAISPMITTMLNKVSFIPDPHRQIRS